MIKILLLLILISSSCFAQSGVALDSWSRFDNFEKDFQNLIFESANVIFVESNYGDDSNSGLKYTQPKQTISSALSVAGNSDTVKVLCAGTFEESFEVQSGVTLYAPLATIEGAINMRGDSRVYIKKHFAHADSATMLNKMDAEHGYYRTINSFSNGYNNVTNIRNATNNSILFADITYMITTGRGVQDFTADTTPIGGHIHVNIRDLYMIGSSVRAIDAANSSSDIIGKIDHIKKMESEGAKIAIQVDGGKVDLMLAEIDVGDDTAYYVGESGKLTLNCLRIVGVKTVEEGGIIRLPMLADGSNALATDTRTNISVYSKAEIDGLIGDIDNALAEIIEGEI